MLFFTVNAVLVARKLGGDQVLINNVFFSLQKDLFGLERELLNNGLHYHIFTGAHQMEPPSPLNS